MIPVFDLKRQNQNIARELDKAIKEVIDSGVYILGPKVAEFERAFAKYLGVKYAVGLACGTDALTLALLSLDIGKGDEVIMPANAYPTAFAVAASFASPKLVDIDPQTYNINPDLIPQAISKKTKAIIAVHLYGQPAEMRKIMEIGRKYHLPVIEDCAQAHGSSIRYQVSGIRYGVDESKILNTYYLIPNTKKDPRQDTLTKKDKSRYRWKKVGSIGDIGCFSFYPTKNLGCFGDGGMAVTNCEELAKKIRLLRMYGEEKRYQSIILGRNSRLDELQAAILLVKLKYLDNWNEKRRKIAKLYESICHPDRASLTGRVEGSSNIKHVYHLFVIRAKERDKLRKYLWEHGIQTAIHYPIPIHLVPSFKFLGYKEGGFPESEKASGEILSLPMWPELENNEIKRVIGAIQRFSTEVT